MKLAYISVALAVICSVMVCVCAVQGRWDLVAINAATSAANVFLAGLNWSRP